MPERIQAIFVDPPIAVARLGGSSEAQEAFTWIRSPNPRANGETAVAPTWTFRVLPDASVEPYLPVELRFRDGPQIRPVCPYFEIWVRLGEPGSDAASWRDTPLTPALLDGHAADLSALVVTIDARNAKAARRTGQASLAFGTFPSISIRGDHHRPVPILGTSPPGAAPPMIPSGRGIPLGFVQLMRSRQQPPDPPWGDIDVAAVRLRFTPGKGLFYGPPDAAATTPLRPHPAVLAENAFLDPAAGWQGAPASGRVEPFDTYDGAEASGPDGGPGASLGIVDDTCEVRIQVSLALPGYDGPLRANANIFVGPPDYGPDRRPFLSLADELNDRAGDGAERSAALTGTDLDQWVEDLFERVFETVSLLNVDWFRTRRAAPVPSDRLREKPLAHDTLPEPERAMGGRDPLRNPEFALLGPTRNEPLPLSEHARTRHRALSDVQELREFVRRRPGRMKELVRRAFEIDAEEGPGETSMRMPPFMRQSNAFPLTLASWQYDLLMRWVDGLENDVVAMAASDAVLGGGAERTASLVSGEDSRGRNRLSEAAGLRRKAVLERLARDPGGAA